MKSDEFFLQKKRPRLGAGW